MQDVSQMPLPEHAEEKEQAMPIVEAPQSDFEEFEEMDGQAPIEEGTEESIDYVALAEADLAQLRAQFPQLDRLSHLSELDNPRRYAELREAGLSPKEALLATDDSRLRQRRYDNRAHLHSAVPKGACGGVSMTSAELSAARNLFEGLSDAELAALYRRATGAGRA